MSIKYLYVLRNLPLVYLSHCLLSPAHSNQSPWENEAIIVKLKLRYDLREKRVI